MPVCCSARPCLLPPIHRRRLSRRAAVDRYLDRFGRALANVIDVLDPDVVVLGGGLSKLEALYDCGRAAVARYVFNDELTTPIVPNRLGDSVGRRRLAAEMTVRAAAGPGFGRRQGGRRRGSKIEMLFGSDPHTPA